ncbi:MAG: UvrD-helicase domain-containing protein [Lachnospiraceae bacterium]|nr:UvrD-helicase domain-containing protein [Lachnospiraceae bacterium]
MRFRIQSEIIQEIIESESIDLRESDRNVIDLLNEISKVKTGYDSVEDYNSILMDNDDFKKFYKRYISRMNSLKLIDFDDMLIRCHDLFIERNEVLRQWQEKSVLPSEIEEERRLFYVGMTRAKEELYLWSIKDNYGKAMTRSHFVDVFEER